MLTVIFSDPWRELPPLMPIPKPFESIGHTSSEMSITPPWQENIGQTNPKFFNNLASFPESLVHSYINLAPPTEISISPPPLTPINQMRKYPVIKGGRGYSGYYGHQNKRPCSVCGDLAPNHLHYGGVACFSCRCVCIIIFSQENYKFFHILFTFLVLRF